MPCGSLHLFTIQIHYSIQNTQWPYISIFLYSIPEAHRPFLYKQCCINRCTWNRHSYNEALLLKEARCRQFGHFPVMGLTSGQTNTDAFAAVKGCFMLFLSQGSCQPADGLSNRSRHAKLSPSEPISHLLHQAACERLHPALLRLLWCWACGLWAQTGGHQGTHSTERGSATLTQPPAFNPWYENLLPR